MSTEPKKKKKKKKAGDGDHQNAARAALVISILSKAGPYGLRFSDVISETELGPATVHRLLNGLVTYGFVDHDPDKNRYFLGIQMVTWAAKATQRYGLAPYVEASLHNLASLTEDTTYFSLLSGRDSVCIDRLEGTYPIRTLTLQIGDRRPLGVGAGSLAILAFQPDEVIEAVLKEDQDRRREYNIARSYLEKAIKTTKANGYALNNEKLIPGMSAVGVAIKNQDQHAVGSISIAAITPRIVGDRLEIIVDWLNDEVQTIQEKAQEVLNIPYIKRFNTK